MNVHINTVEAIFFIHHFFFFLFFNRIANWPILGSSEWEMTFVQEVYEYTLEYKSLHQTPLVSGFKKKKIIKKRHVLLFYNLFAVNRNPNWNICIVQQDNFLTQKKFQRRPYVQYYRRYCMLRRKRRLKISRVVWLISYRTVFTTLNARSQLSMWWFIYCIYCIYTVHNKLCTS